MDRLPDQPLALKRVQAAPRAKPARLRRCAQNARLAQPPPGGPRDQGSHIKSGDEVATRRPRQVERRPAVSIADPVRRDHDHIHSIAHRRRAAAIGGSQENQIGVGAMRTSTSRTPAAEQTDREMSTLSNTPDAFPSRWEFNVDRSLAPQGTTGLSSFEHGPHRAAVFHAVPGSARDAASQPRVPSVRRPVRFWKDHQPADREGRASAPRPPRSGTGKILRSAGGGPRRLCLK